MAVTELNFRKKQMVQELNGFIGLKKAYSAQAATRSELMSGAGSGSGPSEQQLAGAPRRGPPRSSGSVLRPPPPIYPPQASACL